MAVTVSAQMVKELRDLTGAGIMDCKKALIETEGNIEAAVENLRKAGLALAAKKAGRIAAEGLVSFALTEDCKKAAIVEVNSETDFVAKNDLFKEYVADVTKQALATEAADMDSFKKEAWAKDPSKTVEEALVEMVAVIHENIQIRRFEKMESESYIGSYLHGGGRIGVLVDMGCQEATDLVKEAAKNVAMQIAALNPFYLDEASVPADFLAHEKEIILAQIDTESPDKPQEIKEKMSIGKLKKRLKEVCLLDQAYFRDDELTIAKYLDQVSKEAGFPVCVKKFVRFETGEGIEKKKEDFAEEVAKQMQH